MREGIQRGQGCIHSTDSVEKGFLNGSNGKETCMNIPEFVQYKLFFFCNSWPNDYTLDQLNAGMSVLNVSLSVHMSPQVLS